MENSKPWYKSLTLTGVALTALSVFAPKYVPVVSGVITDVSAIAGLVVTVIGRLRATKEVTFTQK